MKVSTIHRGIAKAHRQNMNRFRDRLLAHMAWYKAEHEISDEEWEQKQADNNDFLVPFWEAVLADTPKPLRPHGIEDMIAGMKEYRDLSREMTLDQAGEQDELEG